MNESDLFFYIGLGNGTVSLNVHDVPVDSMLDLVSSGRIETLKRNKSEHLTAAGSGYEQRYYYSAQLRLGEIGITLFSEKFATQLPL